MGKNTNTVWNGTTTEKVFDNTYEFSLSEKIGVLYPTTNSGKNRDKIDETFTNWSVGNPTYSTYQRYTGDNINNIAKTDTKITHKIGLIKYDTYSSYTVQPFNSISDYISYSGETTYQISGNDIRIVNNFDYSDIYVYPKINLRILNKENNATENVNNLTIAQFKQKIDNSETGKDYYIQNINYEIYSKKNPNVGLSNQYCIMSIIDIDDIQFICGAGRNGLFNYNEFRYNQNLGGIIINNNGATKIPTQCYNIKEDLTYTRIDTLNYNSYLKADYKIVMEYIATFGFWFYDGEKFYLPEMKNNQTTGKYFPEEVLEYVDSENKNWGNSANIDNKLPSGGGDTDDVVPMIYGENAGLYGAVKYYTMTPVQLSSFMGALENATIDHPDIASGFVSAYYIPNVLDSITHSTEMPVRVKGVELSGATGGKTIVQKSLVLGSVYVPVRHNNAFDTLTKYFLYTPYTDVIPLNYKCYGKTITIIMLPALQDCTASIIVQCDGMTIAKQTVSLGSSLAIAVENNSEKSTAIVNACTKYLASAGSVIGGAVSGNIPAVAGGAIGVVASTVNVINAIGNTYIHSYGTTTGTSLSLNPQNIYLIEYIVKTDKPDNFASTVGNLCNKELTLSENMGYTVCDNPKIYGTMTLAERTEIENYLRMGVIL